MAAIHSDEFKLDAVLRIHQRLLQPAQKTLSPRLEITRDCLSTGPATGQARPRFIRPNWSSQNRIGRACPL